MRYFGRSTKKFGVISIITMGISLGLGESALADVILFDFGRGDTGSSDLRTTGNWNNVDSLQESLGGGTGGTGIRITDAITDLGDVTTVDLNITDDFSAVNAGGVVANDVYAASAQRDSFFVSSSDGAQIRLEGLQAGQSYDLTFFGSRAAGSPPGRTFQIDITGHSSVSLDTANNADQTVSINTVFADSNGFIVFDITAADVASGTDFGYFGVLEIEGDFALVPEPGSLGLTGVALICVMMRRVSGRRLT